MALYFCLALIAATLLTTVSGQCANNVAIYHPTLRTQTSNRFAAPLPFSNVPFTRHATSNFFSVVLLTLLFSTWFIIPVPKPAVQLALREAFPLQALTLLDVPTTDTSLFPNGFPEGMHPVLASIGLNDDIRMSSFQIKGGLKQGSVYATYVSQKGDPTPLSASLAGYIAGENGPLPNGLVPAVASPLLFAGTPIRLGEFDPDTPPYMSDAAGTLTTQANWAFFPNPLSGPGVYPVAVDMLFRFKAGAETYTDKTFKALINQPNILPSGLCQRNQYYFTNDTALTKFVGGNVTLGPGASGYNVLEGALMLASEYGNGLYVGNEGFTGCAQNVGFSTEGCKAAGMNLDPSALD